MIWIFHTCLLLLSCIWQIRVLDAENLDNIPVFGRHVRLGELYDLKSHTVWTGTSLWKDESLNVNNPSQYVQKRNAFRTKMHVDVSKDEQERMTSLKIEAEMQLSFLSGMVEVSGSAKYLRESKEKFDQEMVDFRYIQESYAMILMDYASPDYTSICTDARYADGTHVISKLVYGIHSNFVFKKVKQKSGSDSELGGELRVSIEKFGAEASAKVEVSEKTKKESKGIEVRFFSDYIVTQHPSNFLQAKQVLKNLTESVGTGDYQLRPVVMGLTPRSTYCSTPVMPQLKTVSNVKKITGIFYALDQMKAQINLLLNTGPALRFHHIKRTLEKIMTEIESFRLIFSRKVARLVPLIRGGDSTAQAVLDQEYKDFENSPLKGVENLIQYRQREISYLSLYLNMFNQHNEKHTDRRVKIAGRDEATKVVEILGKRHVVILNLNLLTSTDSIKNYFQGLKSDETTKWWSKKFIDEQDSTGEIERQCIRFLKFAQENADSSHTFVVSFNEEIYEGGLKSLANVHALVNGLTISRDYQIPVVDTLNDIPLFVSKTQNSITFKQTVPILNPFVTGFIIHVETAGKKELFKKEFTDTKAPTYTVDGLLPNQIYRARFRLVTALGVTPDYEYDIHGNQIPIVSESVITYPASPPATLKVLSQTATSIKVSWLPPTSENDLGNNTVITGYRLKLEGSGYSRHAPTTTATQLEFTVLQPASTYAISIRTQVTPRYFQKIGKLGRLMGEAESLASTHRVTTIPGRPRNVRVDSISFNQVTVKWDDTLRSDGQALPPGVHLMNYVVSLERFPANARTTREYETQKRELVISDLGHDLDYRVKVKMVTSFGELIVESSYSLIIVQFKTKNRSENEGDKFTADIQRQITAEVNSLVATGVKSITASTFAQFNNIKVMEENVNLPKMKLGIKTEDDNLRKELQAEELQRRDWIKSETKNLRVAYRREVTLDGTTIDDKGRVTKGVLYFDGQPVCSNFFSKSNGAVLCRMAGFSGIGSLVSSNALVSHDSYILEGFFCQSSDASSIFDRGCHISSLNGRSSCANQLNKGVHIECA